MALLNLTVATVTARSVEPGRNPVFFMEMKKFVTTGIRFTTPLLILTILRSDGVQFQFDRLKKSATNVP